MQIGQGAWIHVGLLLGDVCFLKMLSFHGKAKSKTKSQNLPQNLSIELCPPHVLKLCGSRVCYVNLVFLSTLLHLFMLITQVLLKLLLILCFMNAPNILKLIITIFVKLLIIIFLHYLIFPPSITQLMSLRRPCLGFDINS